MDMGIPSYFRNILRTYPGCIGSVKGSVLCFDFNCLIYRCLKSMPEYVDHDVWEGLLLEEIKKTVMEVWREAGSPKTVLIAVDGVVPMAKIRQQRVRRFKSAWLKSQGPKEATWDSNSITPGTRFMEKLDFMLGELCASRKWILSGVAEEGEGEHKIMRWLRSTRPSGKIIVYGLDADLILLSMLVGEEIDSEIHLMREKQEFGGKHIDTGVQTYQFMNIREFQKRLGIVGGGREGEGGGGGEGEVLNYIALMSLMGNDFLPHSITHKLSDDGHDFVIQELKGLRASGNWLIRDGKVQMNILVDIFRRWSQGEDDRITYMIKKKQEQARRSLSECKDSETLPLEWAVENKLLVKGRLSDSWRDIYWSWIHPYGTLDKSYICQEYVKGFMWILDYYRGLPVDRTWMFPAWIPPLWTDLAAFAQGSLRSDLAAFAQGGLCADLGGLQATLQVPLPLQPQEQLAMVLPVESWGLIRDPALRRLPILAPQMWPKTFGFFSLGRKWLWECEALIPVLTAARVRQIVS